MSSPRTGPLAGPFPHILFLLLAAPALTQVVPAPGPDQARLHFLYAETLAAQGSPAEALRELALSLRIEPAGNPAADLAFELLTRLRANSPLRFLGHTEAITDAQFSPSGDRLVTASQDHTARVPTAASAPPARG